MLTKSRVVQLLFMLTVLLSLFFWRTFDDNQLNSISSEDEVPENVNILRCNYEEACEFITESGTYLLAINNLPIQAEEWIDFELSVPFENSVVTKAQIAGKTMFMGRIPVKFAKSSEKQFSAKGILGACTVNNMIWELQVTVENDGQSELLSFDFLIVK